MPNQIQNSFQLIALMDGTTINGFLRTEGSPLVQRYNSGTAQFVPDFEAMAENQRPTVVPILRDSATGAVLAPQAVEWAYNGLALTFGTDGLSTNSGMEGVFKKLDAHAATIGSQSYQLPALRVMKNLVPLSGYDNDRITLSGTIETGGQQIAFNELGTEVTIQEATGNVYDILVTNDRGSALTADGETLTETARVYKDGVEVADLSGFTFQWVKETASGDTNMGTAQTQAVTTADVDNVLKLRVDVYKDGSLAASGFDEVTDFSDPYYVNLKITGITGNAVRTGETATITPVAVKRSSGEEQPSLVTEWTFAIKDNKGAAFILTGKQAATFNGASCQVTYADMERAGMGLTGYVTGTF